MRLPRIANASADVLVVGPSLMASSKLPVVLFAHGLGDTGHGWRDVAEMLVAEATWVLPTAPTRPVTINGGARMPAWFDIVSLRERTLDKSGLAGFDESQAYLCGLLRTLQATQRPLLVGGFSQGGAVAIGCAMSSLDAVPVRGVLGGKGRESGG